LFHSFDSAILFHGVKKGYISKGEVGFHIFEAHSSSKRFYLKELCLKNRGLSSSIYNNINILSYFYRSLTAKEIGKTLAI
jgi:hypothetical protein